MDLDEFQKLIANLEQNDTEIVQQVTGFFESALSENPSGIIMLLLQNILSFKNNFQESMSIILLKRFFVSGGSDFISRIDQDTIDFMSNNLPKLFENEELTPYLFTLLVDASSFIVSNLMQQDKMLNFIPSLVKIVKSLSPTLSPPALNCIVQCNNYAASTNDSSLINFQTNVDTYQLISLEDVYLTIATALTNDFSLDFTIAALRMLFSFFIDGEKTPQLGEFAEAVSEVYSSIPEQNLALALSDLYVFVDHTWNYFSETLPALISTLLSIVEKNNGNSENGQQIQTNVINIFVCFAKNIGIEFKPFLNDVVASVFIASCNISEESMLDDDIESNEPYSDVAIYYLSEIFSSRTEYQTLVIKLAQEMIQREEWNCRRSALSSIYQLLLSCDTGLESYFKDIMSMAQEHLSDPNHLCRYYSFKSISELSESYSLFVCQYVQTLVPLIIAVFKAEIHHQTKIAELECLESICSNVPSESISPVAQSITDELLPQIEDSDADPMEQLMIIKCISEISLSTQVNSEEFYSESIGWLKAAIDQIQPGNEDPIRIQAIKTIPLVGRTVNLEQFGDDGIGFLNLLLGDAFTKSKENEKSSILYFIQEMSEILPRDAFNQFIAPIFDQLDKIVSAEFDVEELPFSCDISSLSDKIAIPLRSENIVMAYSRAQLDLNKTCIEVIISLTENLKELVIPFVKQISKTVSGFIKAAYCPPLQSATLNLYDSLIVLYREFDPPLLSLFLGYIRKILFSDVSNIFANPISVLCETFDLLSHSLEGSQFDGNFTALLLNFLYQQIPIKRERTASKSANENSPELISLDELEISIENFAQVLLEQFTQNMVEFSPILLHSQCNIFHVLYSTDLYLVMKDSESNLVDLGQLINTIFESLNSTRMNLAYASFISLSKIIQSFSVDAEFIQQSIEKVSNAIQQYEDDEDDLLRKVIDGALIALSAIFKAADEKTDLSSIIPIWFQHMPVLLDDPNSNIAYDVFCIFFKERNPKIFKEDSIAHLLEICSIAIGMKKISTEIKEQLIVLLKELFSDEEMSSFIQEAISTLSIKDRKNIQSVF